MTAIAIERMPLRYGSEMCCLVTSEPQYTADIVKLRNNPAVNRYIHHDHLTEESHERWLKGETMRSDSLNFVILIKGRFAGTASLYHIEAGKSCEYGRMVMPLDNRRIYAVAVEFLCLSLAFDILQVLEVRCTVARENSLVLDFHLRNGWMRAPHLDGFTRINGSEIAEVGLTMDSAAWQRAVQNNRDLLRRLHKSDESGWC